MSSASSVHAKSYRESMDGQNEFHLPKAQKDIQIVEIESHTCASRLIKFWKKITSIIKKIALKIFNAFKEKEHPLDTEAKREYQELLPVAKELKEKIRDLDTFISSKPDLDAICRDYISKFPHRIVMLKKVTIENYDKNEPLDRACKLSLKCIDLQHALDERIRFIKRHKEIYELFEKYLLEELHNANQTCKQIKELFYFNEI